MGKHALRTATLASLASLALTACEAPPGTTTASVSGTATYRERIALPPDAAFEARIEDISRADAPATVIANTRIEPAGSPPFRFTIEYDPAKLAAHGHYAIRARVVHGDKLLFTSSADTPLPPAGSSVPVDIMMFMAPESAAVAPQTPAAASAGELRGLYSYMADAGLFTDCASHERLPVAQEGDNAALETAYLAAQRSPGQALLATVVGRIETRPQMEGPARATLIVEQFVSVGSGDCESRSTATLENTYWKLVQAGGVPVKLAAQQREPYFVLHSTDHRVAGYAGCNRMSGAYTLAGDKLNFTQMAVTMMACAQGMEIEQAFNQALEKVAAWRIDGEELELIDAGGEVVATFESRYLR